MRAIILAAGQPSFTASPISNLRLESEFLLDVQISCLRNGGVEEVTLVAGYRAVEVRRADIDIRINPRWQSRGSASSLAAVRDLLDGSDDLMLLYGDTLFEPWVVRSLAEASHPLSVVCLIERFNRDLGQYREFAEIEDGTLKRVGPAADGHGVRGVFSGMCLVRKHKAAALRSALDELNDDSGALHLGDLFNRMLRRGVDVNPVIVERGWAELSSEAGYREALADRILLERVIQIHTDWTQRAERYDKLDWVNNDSLLSAITRLAREVGASRVLDVGTGSGKVLLAVRDTLGAGEYWGVDSSQAMLDKVASREHLTLRLCAAEKLEGVPDRHFDLVTARMVFHHVNDTASAVRSVHRVLAEGGCFALCEGVPPSLRTVRWYTEMFRYKEDRKTLTEVDLINLLVQGGFSDVCTRTIIMRDASLNNWIDNAGIPGPNVQIIKDMHFNAPPHVREDYDMRMVDGDCLMTWKFALTFGFKRR
jgi:ubiquinone/menaquinone biosynthesis C-methylase UbiE/choline kinase